MKVDKNKKVRVYVNGERQKDMYQHRTSIGVFFIKVKYFLKSLLRFVLFCGFVFLMVKIGVEFGKANVERNPIEIVKEVRAFPPILKKIAWAESHNSHYCTEQLVKYGLCKKGAVGQVLVNSTLDVGRYAINLYYNGKWCADRGYNIFDEKDNENCALDLFAERGSEPWNASKHNWNK